MKCFFKNETEIRFPFKSNEFIISIIMSKRIYRTCISSICQSGLSISLVKSGIQKSLRRRELVDMQWYVNEMHDMFVSAVTEKEKKAGRAILTNLKNRLLIMMSEEMLFSEVFLYTKIRKMMDDFANDEQNVQILFQICDLMVNSKLCRLASDANAYFGLGGCIVPERNVFEFEREESETDRRNRSFGLLEEIDMSYIISKKDSEKVLDIAQQFYSHLKNKNPECIYWAILLHNVDKNEEGFGCKRRFNRMNPVYIIWSILDEFSKMKKTFYMMVCVRHLLFEYFADRPEKKLFLINAIFIVLYRDVIDWKYTDENTNYQNYQLRKDGAFEPKPYVYDMHTVEGRKMGKNIIDFAEEGSVVVSEDLEFYQEKWREYYLEIKYKEEKVVKEKKEKVVKEKVVKEKKEKVVKEKVVKEKKEKVAKEKKVRVVKENVV